MVHGVSAVRAVKAWANALVGLWRALRRRYWLALAFDVAALVLVFGVISAWQSHHLLAADGSKTAPDFVLKDLSGRPHRLATARGKTALVYFFAPWCHICELSSANVQALRAARAEDDLAIYMVALSYESAAEVEDFAARHELTVPVLLGHNKQIADYQIRGFPTYYVVAADGRLRHRAVGYSTEIGLRWRTW